MVVVLFSLILECRSNARLRRGGAALLLLLWLVAATLLTFLGPFTTTGNGFFACWGGLLCAFAFTWHEGGLGAAEPPPAAPARARSNSITAAATAAASKIAAAGPQRLQLVCLGSASVVVLASAVPAAGVGDGLGDYALCVGAVSLCAVGFVLGALRACAPLLDKRNKGPQRLTLRQARSLRRPAGPPARLPPPPPPPPPQPTPAPASTPFSPHSSLVRSVPLPAVARRLPCHLVARRRVRPHLPWPLHRHLQRLRRQLGRAARLLLLCAHLVGRPHGDEDDQGRRGPPKTLRVRR